MQTVNYQPRDGKEKSINEQQHCEGVIENSIAEFVGC